jgi:hypothetical protein
MSFKDDFQKEWPKIRKQLQDIGREAAKLAHKGEEELVKISKKGKMRLDATSINLKREKLYYELGKTYAKEGFPGAGSPALKKIVGEIEKLESQSRSLKRKLKKAKM